MADAEKNICTSLGKQPASEMTEDESRKCMKYWSGKNVQIPEFDTLEEMAGWMLIKCKRAHVIENKYWVEKFT